MTIQIGRWLGQAGVVLLLGGCPNPGDPSTPDSMELRFIHASFDAPKLDLYLTEVSSDRSMPLFTNVNYASFTQFKSVTPGRWRLELRPAGDPSGASLIGIDTVLSRGQRMEVIAAGVASSNDPALRLRLLTVEESFGSMAASSIRLRAVHASPDAPALQLDFGNDGTLEVDGLERFADSDQSGVELQSNVSTQVGLLVEGRILTSFTLPPLPAATSALLVVSGYVGKTGDLQGLVLVAPGVGLLRHDPELYVLNLNFDLGAFDVYRSGELALDHLEAGAVGRLIVPTNPVYQVVDFCRSPDAPPSSNCLSRSIQVGNGLPGGSPLSAGAGYVWIFDPHNTYAYAETNDTLYLPTFE